MNRAEEHFKKRQLDLNRICGVEGTRAPPPTAIETPANDIGKVSMLIAENRKVMMMVESLQIDLESLSNKHREANEHIESLQNQLESLSVTEREHHQKKVKATEEIRVGEFKLKKAREEIQSLKDRVTEMSKGHKSADGGYDLKRENNLLKKMIREQVLPLLEKDAIVIQKYEVLARMKQESEDLLSETERLVTN